jgi:hypothetical protein
MKKQLLLLTASTLVLAGSVTAAHAQGGTAGPMMQSDQPGGMMRHQRTEGEEEGSPQRRQPPAGMRGMMGGPHMLTMLMIMVDTDGDGTLSLAEVQAVHARVFNYADGDDDGKLTLEEMQRFFRGHQGDSED